MPAAAIATLVGVALTVAALAFFLIHVIILLARVHFNLGTIVAGVRAIAFQVTPLDQVIGDMNRDLRAVQSALEDLLASRLGDLEPVEGDGHRPTPQEPAQYWPA